MSSIMVRACVLQCKEYVIIDPIDQNNQYLIRLFEMRHSGHSIATIQLSEVEGYCKNVENELFASIY